MEAGSDPFRRLVLAEAERVLRVDFLQAGFRFFQGFQEFRVAVAGEHDFARRGVERMDVAVAFGDRRSVDEREVVRGAFVGIAKAF